MLLNRSTLAAAVAVGLAAAAGSAFTAANTGTPTTSVGQASTVTGGFAVSNVKYLLDTTMTTGDRVDKVTFTLTASGTSNVAQQARLRLVTGAAYYECVVAAASLQATDVTCTIAAPNLTSSQVNTLDIVATSDKAL